MIHPKKILEQHNLQPNKVMGQSFLINKKVLDKMIETADLSKDDIVLEIGAGLGILTQELSEKVKRVIAVEKDVNLAKILREQFQDCDNVQIEQGDILKIKPRFRERGNYKIVANLPYYITSPVIRTFLEAENSPQEMTLMIQKEVAQRICAKPPRMNLLAVSVQFYGAPRVAFYVSKNSFWPKPKVDSAVIKITDIKKPKNAKIFFKVIKAGFSAPRKQLANNLSKKLQINKETVQKKLTEYGLPETARAENLSVKNWADLTLSICDFSRPASRQGGIVDN